MRVDLARLGVEQPGELARVRRQHGRRGACERLERPERVRVEDDRQLELLEQDPHQLDRPVAAAEPRPERDRVRALGRLEHGVGGARQQPAGGVLGQRPLHHLEQRRLENRQRRLRRRERDVARVGAEGGEGRQHRRAGEPARAADHQHGARAVLRRLVALAGHLEQRRRRHERVLVRLRAQADRREVHVPRVEPSRRDRQADLRRAEGDGRGGDDGGAGHLAGRGVDARRDVDGDDGAAARIDELDHALGVLARGVAQADPEQRVHDHVRLAEVAEAVDDRDVATRLAQHARAHAPVAAVVAAAADDRHTAREPAQHDVGDRRAGAFHQLVQRPLVRRLSGARLLRRQERLEPHSSTTTATAAASSRL